jgi:hypothetical protein
MNNDHKKNKNSNNNNNEKNNEKNNDNKILIDYFNSMYIDCINFTKDKNQNNQCDFIKEKIHSLNQTKNPDNSRLRHHIVYAVAK